MGVITKSLLLIGGSLLLVFFLLFMVLPTWLFIILFIIGSVGGIVAAVFFGPEILGALGFAVEAAGTATAAKAALKMGSRNNGGVENSAPIKFEKEKDISVRSSWDWKKIVLGIVIIGLLVLVVSGGLLFSWWVFGGIIGVGVLVFLMLKNPSVFGFIGTLIKGVLFAVLLIALVFLLGIYGRMPALFLLIIEIILVSIVLKIDTKAGFVTLLILLVFVPYLHYYATNVASPDSVLAQSITTAEQQLQTGIGSFSPSQMIESATRAAKKQIALASGDYYTASVDAGAKKQLGVFMDDIRTTQKNAVFFAGDPLTFFTKIDAQALDFSVNLKLSCVSDAVQGKVTPETKDFFGSESVDATALESTDVDCVFPEDLSKKFSIGTHTAKIIAGFNFATRGYLPVYFMDKDNHDELERRNLMTQWTANLPPNAFAAITTSGPVHVGLGVGDQPVAVDRRDKNGPTIGISIENAGSGHVKGLTSVLLMLPKGLGVKDVNADPKNAVKISCGDLEGAEQKGCDDAIMDVYKITATASGTSTDFPYDFFTLRIHTVVNDYSQLVGVGRTATSKKVRSTIIYDYELNKEKSFSVRSPQPFGGLT